MWCQLPRTSLDVKPAANSEETKAMLIVFFYIFLRSISPSFSAGMQLIPVGHLRSLTILRL